MTLQHEELLPIEIDVTRGDSLEQPRLERLEPAPQSPATASSEAPSGQALEHWRAIQGKFVDDPRGSVADARALVDDLIQQVVRNFAEHSAALDLQWSTEPTISTEQLRLCLQQYRTLFTQLLPVVPAGGTASVQAQR